MTSPSPTRAESTPTLQWNSLRHELLWIWDGAVEETALDVVANHRHGYWLWLLRQGEVSVQMGRQEWNARQGQWMVCPIGSTAQHFTPGARILSIHFRCEWPTGENLFEDRAALVADAAKFPQLEARARELERLVSRNFPGIRVELLRQATGYPEFLELQQRFLAFLAEFYRLMEHDGRTMSRGGGGDERLWRAVECLQESPLAEPFPAERLQQETALGLVQLNRLFREEYGQTAREYREALRLQSALSSLESTSISIKEVGYNLGFKQPSHFTKWFSRKVGKSPQQYRKSVQAEPEFADRSPAGA
ncbi:MAG: AraC family transcriptional regulator [Verrucomicrobiota bacterium]